MQNDWIKYKQTNFEFEILKECDFKYLDRYEDFYTRKYDAINSGYSNKDTFNYLNLSIEQEQNLHKKLIHMLQNINNGNYYLNCFSKALNIKDNVTSILFKDLQWEHLEQYDLKIIIDSDIIFGNKIIKKNTYKEWQSGIDKTLNDFYL